MNIKRSIVSKLIFSIIVFIALVLTPLYYSITQLVTSFYEKKEADELRHFTKLYFSEVKDSGSAEELQHIEKVAQAFGYGFMIANITGEIKYRYHSPIYPNEQRIDPEDVRTAIEGKIINKATDINNEHISYIMIGYQISEQTNREKQILLVHSVTESDGWLFSLRNNIALGSFGALLLASGLAILLSNRLSRPLLQMEKTTYRISNGDYLTRVQIQGSDEVARLGESINQLAIHLNDHRTSRQKFLSDISHELRTPLTYIQGFTDALQNKLVPNEKDREHYLEIIGDETKRLNRLIEDLFTLAQLDEGKLSLQLDEFSLDELIETSILKLSVKTIEKEITIHQDLEGGSLFNGDGNRMMQVILNILENAIQYTPNGGSIFVSLKETEHQFEIRIADTGIGIVADEITLIWERFYRTEKSRSRANGGTGIGLSIVKEIVELHDGKIEASSEPGKGTCFTLILPRIGKETES